MTLQEKIGLLIFLVLFGFVYLKELYLFLNFIHKRSFRQKAASAKKDILLHSFAIFGIICIFYGYFIEPSWIKVDYATLSTDKLKKTSLTIVQISDLHSEINARNENKLARIINPLNPDLIFFTGDAINSKDAVTLFKKTLKSLKARIGKFAVRGNFDVFIWWDVDLFSNTGFKVLTQDTVKLTKNGEIVFVSGLSRLHPKYCGEVLKKVPVNSYSIFLYHDPDLIEDAKNANVDLYLCGHTHGGQVRIPFYGAIVTLSKLGKKYEMGKYKVGKTILYVNRGIGMEPLPAPQVRFLAPPEITVITIAPCKKQ